MAWIKVEASVRTHEKFLAAGPAACWLWLCGLAYCQEGLTDGFIPFAALKHLGVKGPATLKGRLVDVGLWHDVSGGWQVHGYLKHNRSADQVERIRSERAAGGIKGGRPTGSQKPSRQTLKVSTSETLEVSTTETLKANLTRNPSQLISDQLISSHQKTGTALTGLPDLEKCPNESGNYQVICKVVRELLQEFSYGSEAELIDAAKRQCAALQIAYGPPLEALDVVHRACASELFKHRRPALRRQGVN